MSKPQTLLLAGVAAIAIVAAAWWFNITADAPPEQSALSPEAQATGDIEPPPPLPYEFLTLPGLQRGDPDREFIVIPSLKKKLPFHRLSTMLSEEDEDKIAFLHRVREEMSSYSDNQTYEACAEICTDGTRHAVIVSSISAVAYCAVKAICPEGYQPMGQSIHSHCPKLGRLRATLADEYLSGGTLTRGKTFARCDTETFSQTDFVGRRPGWLAGRKALYRHDGPARINVFDNSAP